MRDFRHSAGDVAREAKLGFSLVEIVLSMFILAMFVLAVTKGLTFAKYTAESNLYHSTSLTVAVSTIEQMKGASIHLLENPPKQGGKEIFQMVVKNGQVQNLVLDEENTLSVPLVTEEDGTITKSIDIEMVPSITAMDSGDGFWLEIDYTYKHPQTGRELAYTIRNARTIVRQ